MLPVVHTSSEEIARYLVGRLRCRLQAATQQTVDMIEVVLEDVPGQLASYRHSVSD